MQKLISDQSYDPLIDDKKISWKRNLRRLSLGDSSETFRGKYAKHPVKMKIRCSLL